MARRKIGALTGHTDIKMRDICVGDYIKTKTTAYQVNAYGLPYNPIVGALKWAIIGDCEVIDEATYVSILSGKATAGKVVESPLGEKLGWPHEGEEEEPKTDELREALAEAEEAGVPSEQQPRDLSIFTDEELRSELASRGYRGKLEHTYTVTVTDTLEL